jgi:SEC-C motif-containing protein
MTPAVCPCGTGQAFADCCGRYLTGRAQPATPEQLMRSRYSAFCTGNIDYLIATHHPTQRGDQERQALAQTIAETEWLSLRVLAATENQVEFVAFYKTQGELGQLHERSNFVQHNGQWVYVDGMYLPPIKLERNDPCWCGSGKKLKQCHVVAR